MSNKVDLSEFYTVIEKSCKVAKLATKLSAEDKEKFEAALAEKKISVQAICNWLTPKVGEVVKNATLRQHRAGGCACE
jgi:hypothetical protein